MQMTSQFMNPNHNTEWIEFTLSNLSLFENSFCC